MNTNGLLDWTVRLIGTDDCSVLLMADRRICKLLKTQHQRRTRATMEFRSKVICYATGENGKLYSWAFLSRMSRMGPRRRVNAAALSAATLSLG